MTAQRPNVIVFQEYEEVTVTPDIPDLRVLIVGPCHQILDYVDDKDDCEAEDYGTEDANCPLVSPSAVVLATPPNLEAGAQVDSSSVEIYFDATSVVLKESTAGAGTPDKAQYWDGNNLFVAHDTTGGAHFGGLEVAAGDILYTNSSGTDDFKMTVKEVLYVLNDFGGTLDFITNGVQAGDIVTLAADNPPGGNPRDGTYTVLRVRDEENLEFTGLDWVGHAETLFGGTDTVSITVTDPNGAVRLGPSVVELADYSDLRCTSDFIEDSAADYDWRVERLVNDIQLDSSDFSIDGNQITVNGGITVDLSSTLTDKKVSHATIYVQYEALRTDLQSRNTFSNVTEMISELGKYDSRNPLLTGAVVAKANTTTPVDVFGLYEDSLAAYLDFIDKISTIREIYAIVPLTYNTSVLAALTNMAETLADPNEVLDSGVRQKFRMILGAVDLLTQEYRVSERSGGTSLTESNTAPSGNKKMTITYAGAVPAINLSTIGVIPGDKVVVTSGGTPTTYVVAHLNGTLVLETDDVFVTNSLSTGDSFKITNAAGTTEKYTEYTLLGGDTLDLTAGALDDLYLILECATANFITNGVIPGDILQIPNDPEVDSWTTGVKSFVINEVISNQRVAIVNNGNNTSALENELPHLYKRIDGSAISAGQIWCRVLRNMTKDQQVAAMVAVANSFSSKRLILAYPDLVDVTDLVDGSKTRTDPETPELADPQPGYYLACAIGGQTAGNPPHQGFTNLGIAGISRLYNSNDYFKDELLTTLSNGGVYVFTQENINALPLSIHEVTTDVSALEFSEYMIVKNFDFVAWTFLDTLLPFIGLWNVYAETIEFIRQALESTGDTLKGRYVAKLGTPLVDYTIDSVAESTISPDRIEAFVDVDLPKTLNTIGLHLVA